MSFWLISSQLLLLYYFYVSSIACFKLTNIDSGLIDNLFINAGPYQVVKNGYSNDIINQTFSDEFEIIVPALMNEDCAIECWRNMLCVRYSFSVSKNICKIRLSPFKRNYLFDNDTSMMLKDLSLDLENCKDGMYCLDSTNGDGKLSRTICDPANLNGKNCGNSPIYEFSEWTTWSNCSETGFKKRTRYCLKTVYDTVLKKNQTEKVPHDDRLCGVSNEASYEVETCEFNIYTSWSQWTSCSRNCNGLRSRKRECLYEPNHQYCSKYYLIETERCSLPYCQTGLLKLDSSTPVLNNSIPSSGLLTLRIKENESIKLITLKPENFQKIAIVACKELGFSDFNRVSARTSNELKQLYKKNTMNKTFTEYINERSWNGIECMGNEKSIKDCLVTSNATMDNILYELQLDCLVNGYWSPWASTSECSVTCGSGLRTRIRVCNEPPPTISETKNGTYCPGSTSSQEECVMPRCQKFPIP